MKKAFVLGIMFLLFVALPFSAIADNNIESKEITNFEECVAAGGNVAESHPRQCEKDGKVFIEEIKEYVGIGFRLHSAIFLGPSRIGDRVLSEEAKKREKEFLEKFNESQESVRRTIRDLVCDGPAALAGLKKGDIVVAIDGVELTGLTNKEFSKTLLKKVSSRSEGESVKFTIKREGADEQFDVTIVLRKIPKKFDCE